MEGEGPRGCRAWRACARSEEASPHEATLARARASRAAIATATAAAESEGWQ